MFFWQNVDIIKNENDVILVFAKNMAEKRWKNDDAKKIQKKKHGRKNMAD